MKSLFLILFFFTIAGIAKAQKNDSIVIEKDTNNINAPFNDDSSLFPDKYGIYREPEKFPTFPGGNKALLKFLSKNTKWPDKSGIIDVQGKVFITFVVEKNGTLTHFKVTKSLDPRFDKEALRAIKLSPRWIPGKVKGKKVRCWYTVPFNFSLN